jgi:hypothetical protein
MSDVMTEINFDELLVISETREAMARQAELMGDSATAKEHRLMAALASEVLEYREIYGALPERGFLTR